MLDLLADEVEGHARRKHQIADPRNPVAGTKLLREWDGTEHTVTVLKDGFDWQGRKYKSLSAVARAITGTRWNGYRFFGLSDPCHWRRGVQTNGDIAFDHINRVGGCSEKRLGDRRSRLDRKRLVNPL